MDATTITTLITQEGFPVAACIALFWYMYKSEQRHKSETDKLAEALNNNTLVVQRLVDAMRKDGVE